MKTLVVEDVSLFRDVLVRMCERVPGCTVLGSTGSGAEAIRLCDELRPDLLVLDLELEDLDGFAVIEHVEKVLSGARVVVVTGYCNAYTLMRLNRTRIDVCLDKDELTLPLLIDAMQAAQLRRHFPSSVLERARRAWRRDPDAVPKLVSKTEEQVLGFISRGLSDAEIAKELSVSMHTAHNHRKHLLKKLKFETTLKLCVWARRQGFSGFAKKLRE